MHTRFIDSSICRTCSYHFSGSLGCGFCAAPALHESALIFSYMKHVRNACRSHRVYIICLSSGENGTLNQRRPRSRWMWQASARHVGIRLKLRSKGASIQNRLPGGPALALSSVLRHSPSHSRQPPGSSRSSPPPPRSPRRFSAHLPLSYPVHSFTHLHEMFTSVLLLLAAAVSPALATVYVSLCGVLCIPHRSYGRLAGFH